MSGMIQRGVGLVDEILGEVDLLMERFPVPVTKLDESVSAGFQVQSVTLEFPDGTGWISLTRVYRQKERKDA